MHTTKNESRKKKKEDQQKRVMPYLRANFTCITTIHCPNFGSEPFLTMFHCSILSLLPFLYTVTSIPLDMEVIVQHWACGEDSLYLNSYIDVAVPQKEDAHEEQPLAHEECAHKEQPFTHKEQPPAHKEQPLTHGEHAHKEQPLAHDEHAHEEQPPTHEEQPFTHNKHHLTYKEHAHTVHETHTCTTENHAGWQAPNHLLSGVMAIDTSSTLYHWKPPRIQPQINSNLHITPNNGWHTMYGLAPQTNKTNVNLSFCQPRELLFRSPAIIDLDLIVAEHMRTCTSLMCEPRLIDAAFDDPRGKSSARCPHRP